MAMKIFCALLGAVVLLAFPASAQQLNCIDFSKGPAFSPRPGDPASITIKMADAPASVPRHFKITGGGCNFEPTDGAADGRAPVIFMPEDGGYTCKMQSTSTVFAKVTAYAIACGIAEPNKGARVPFSNVGLGGNTVAVARSGAGPIPYSIRICNVSGGQPIAVVLSDSDTRNVAVNNCLSVDTPQRAFFRTPNTVDVDEFGYYSLFQVGTFSKTPQVGTPAPVDQKKRIDVGSFRSAAANCQAASPGEAFDAKDYWGYCTLSELKNNKNYRLCFDDGYSNQGDALEYPGSLLPVILDKALMARPPANGQLDYYAYMYIEPNGCRDLFGVTDARVLVTGKNDWNNQSIKSILYRIAEIPAAH
jgi:hypothetical protein